MHFIVEPISDLLQREVDYDSLWHFCKSKRKGLEDLKNSEQPIIEVAKINAVLNHLNPTCKPPSASSKFPAKCISLPHSTSKQLLTFHVPQDLIPELCAKFTVPARCVAPREQLYGLIICQYDEDGDVTTFHHEASGRPSACQGYECQVL